MADPATLAGASASSLRFEIIRPTLGFVVRPFGAIALWPLLTSAIASKVTRDAVAFR
jgi:hypothetical protein